VIIDLSIAPEPGSCGEIIDPASAGFWEVARRGLGEGWMAANPEEIRYS